MHSKVRVHCRSDVWQAAAAESLIPSGAASLVSPSSDRADVQQMLNRRALCQNRLYSGKQPDVRKSVATSKEIEDLYFSPNAKLLAANHERGILVYAVESASVICRFSDLSIATALDICINIRIPRGSDADLSCIFEKTVVLDMSSRQPICSLHLCSAVAGSMLGGKLVVGTAGSYDQTGTRLHSGVHERIGGSVEYETILAAWNACAHTGNQVQGWSVISSSLCHAAFIPSCAALVAPSWPM